MYLVNKNLTAFTFQVTTPKTIHLIDAASHAAPKKYKAAKRVVPLYPYRQERGLLSLNQLIKLILVAGVGFEPTTFRL